MKLTDADATQIEAFRQQLTRKAMVVNTAQLSLMERVREFIQRHGYNGGKSGRADYRALVGLDEIERIKVALAEYDRVRAIPASEFVERAATDTREG